MNTISFAIFGTCILLVAQAIPIAPSAKHAKLAAKKALNIAPRSMSSYGNSLTESSGLFNRVDGYPDLGYYYQAIEIIPTVEGDYTFSSESYLDTMGYLYDTTFDPSVPKDNLLFGDDDSADAHLQFSITATLKVGHTYVLVITTHGDGEIGEFSIYVNGPASVELNQITPTTSKPINVLPPEVSVTSTYSNHLTSASGVFHRYEGNDDELYHFEAIEFKVETSGYYKLTSQSELDTMGYLYDTTFDPSVPDNNLIAMDDDSGDASLQFEVAADLEAGNTYVLVITTHGEGDTGDFSVLSYGPATLSFTAITPVTSQAISSPNIIPTASSSFASELSGTSDVFQRPDGDLELDYYYKVFQFTVPTSGKYIFSSESEDDMDTMGYLYENSFDPSNPTENLLIEDDDSGNGYYQFEIEANLEAEKTYVLLVTTHGDLITGSFELVVKGPASINI